MPASDVSLVPRTSAKIRAFAPLLPLLAFVWACTGGTHDAMRAKARPAAPAEPVPVGAFDDRAESKAYAPPEATAAPAPAAAREAASDGDAYRPTPSPRPERPGLGTEWGETRTSRVSSAPFERDDVDNPLSASSLFYNDEAGVRAMLGSDYWNRRTDGISAARGAIRVRLVDAHGVALPTFSDGARSYVVGQAGDRYVIRLENRTAQSFEAVATVDGLDVIDGQPGSLSKRGYLISPWASVEIDGFRQSEDQVAAFRFGRVKDSYAARRGSDRNVGVIGVAIFQERGQSWPWTQQELERRRQADPFPGRFAPAP